MAYFHAPRRRSGWHVMVMAKAPRPGQSKTRLCPPLSLDQASDLAAAALADTLTAVARCQADRKILALQGAPGDWIPPGFELITQRGLSFADRLSAAWSDASGPGLQIGMDTPQVTAGLLDACLDAAILPGRTAALGLAADGGWWCIGLAAGWDKEPFAGVPMSTPATGRAQLSRLQRLGHHVQMLPCLRDVDRFDDALAVAQSAPGTRFARALVAVGGEQL